MLFCISALDTRVDDTARQFQHALMEEFHRQISPQGLGIISNGHPEDDYCFTQSWAKYCDCTFSGLIKKIEVEHFDFGNFAIDFAPPTVEILKIRVCNQCYKVDTRRLPRKAQIINLSCNKIFGSVDLRHLPPGLEELRMRENAISGRVNLQQLPNSLRHLNLSQNRIRQKRIFVEERESLLYVNFFLNEVDRIVIFGSDGTQRVTQELYGDIRRMGM